jgi:hypothetical protein
VLKIKKLDKTLHFGEVIIPEGERSGQDLVRLTKNASYFQVLVKEVERILHE